MPFYEYECKACKYYLEVLQKISDAPMKKCPSCGKQSLQRLVSAPVFRLKGSGWYETDFKSDKEQKRNLVGEGEKESKDTETKSDAKPAEAAAKPAVESSSGSSSTPNAGTGKAAPAKAKPVKKAAKTKAPAKKGKRR